MTAKELYTLVETLNQLFNELSNELECTIIYDAMTVATKYYNKRRKEKGKKHMEEWTLIAADITGTTLGEFLRIVEDALSHGFEFKVENGQVYTRLQ